MALAGLLGAVSPVLGGGEKTAQPDTSSAAATTTTTTTVTMGNMSKSNPVALLVFGLVLYWLLKGANRG